MATREELQTLADQKLLEAKALHTLGYFEGAYYLGGYAVEMALKARICRLLDLEDYPDEGEISKSFKTHNLKVLVDLAGLRKVFNRDRIANPGFGINWDIYVMWNVDFRYNPRRIMDKIDAYRLIDALEHPLHGVFTWVRKQW